jgi:hypothetical protein
MLAAGQQSSGSPCQEEAAMIASSKRIGQFAAGLAFLALFPAAVCAQAPRVGQVERLRVITLSLHVGSMEKESRKVTYTPPPGWYVRNHTVSCTRRYGDSSFSVSTVPQDWEWLSEDKVRESYKTLLDLAARVHDLALGAKLVQERDATLRELQRVRANHHALVLDATARGAGFFRGGSGLDLTVTADLVYVGTDASLARTAAQRQARIQAGTGRAGRTTHARPAPVEHRPPGRLPAARLTGLAFAPSLAGAAGR